MLTKQTPTKNKITFSFFKQSISPAVIEAAAFLALRLCAGNEETIEAFLAMGTGQLIVNALKKCQHESVIGQLAWLLFYIAYNEAYMKQLMELGMMDAVLYHLQQLNSSSSNNVFSLTAFLRILGKNFLGYKEPYI